MARNPYSVHPGLLKMGRGDKGTFLESPEAYLEAAPGLVDAMFAGKQSLRPVYDQLLKVCLAVGKEATASPGKTIVPIYRNHVIAQIKPTTKTRIDLGLALGNMKTPKRLIDTGGFQKKDRITRRIAVTSAADIDADLKKWLKTAYDLDS
jgi:hypothetical protein